MSNKEIRTVKASTKQVSPLRYANKVRDFHFEIDEPEKLGGTNTAPTPLEYILGSFNSCLLIVVEMVAKQHGYQYEYLQSDTVAEIDRRGIAGVDGVIPYYKNVTSEIEVISNESDEVIEKWKEEVLKRCPAYNLFLDAAIDINLNWSVTK
ncbi:OsmC family protein [Gracilibacillus marinus]|jgi:uncharacterized OsmC-like protein|uniref:OsmC family protein n=1 Tax=Gracilibacillus marinus TaxID=630535 RepID=A0ABV8VQG1_9BACI